MIEELKRSESYQGKDAMVSMCSNNAGKFNVSFGYWLFGNLVIWLLPLFHFFSFILFHLGMVAPSVPENCRAIFWGDLSTRILTCSAKVVEAAQLQWLFRWWPCFCCCSVTHSQQISIKNTFRF